MIFSMSSDVISQSEMSEAFASARASSSLPFLAANITADIVKQKQRRKRRETKEDDDSSYNELLRRYEILVKHHRIIMIARIVASALSSSTIAGLIMIATSVSFISLHCHQ